MNLRLFYNIENEDNVISVIKHYAKGSSGKRDIVIDKEGRHYLITQLTDNDIKALLVTLRMRAGLAVSVTEIPGSLFVSNFLIKKSCSPSAKKALETLIMRSGCREWYNTPSV